MVMLKMLVFPLKMVIFHSYVDGNDIGWCLSPTPLKNMTSSVGMMKFPIYGKIKAMFQTTNQYTDLYLVLLPLLLIEC